MLPAGRGTGQSACPICGGARVELFCRVADRDRPSDREWEVWRCSDCRYGFTRPDVPPEEIGSYYPESYLGEARATLEAFAAGTLQKSRSWRHETEKVELVERFRRQGRILDVGASTGRFLLALDGGRWRRVGVEYIEPVVELVRARFPELSLHPGDVYSQELEPGTFDVITFWHVFEHLFEPRRVLARIGELLRPGGLVVISVPNFDSWQARFFGRHWYALDLPRHLHHYSPRALAILLEEAGLAVKGHFFFSRRYNVHQLKHSLVHWSEEKFSSRVPYYLLKPLLMLVPWVEALGSRYGTLTMVARRS